jgi:flagellin-like hook-associated protein FlgL
VTVVGLGKNIAALRAQAQLNFATASLAGTLERLASGQRINRASDDAAGLSIATSLNAASPVYDQGLRNINDGISALNIADSAGASLMNILQRQRELATSAANGIFSLTQRLSLDKESSALTEEYNRIIQSTRFNGRMMIDGTEASLTLQAGFGNEESLSLSPGQGLQRNVGDGTLSQSVSFDLFDSLGLNTGGGAAMDVDGDGNQDLVLSCSDNQVYWMKGRGDGTFADAVTLNAPSASATTTGPVRTVDVNNDGRKDIVVLGGTRTAVFINQGGGTYSARATYGSVGAGLAVDLNNDGAVDLVGNDGKALFNRGDGTFGAATTIFSAPSVITDLAAGDINGDGALDLVLGGGNGSYGEIRVFAGNGRGAFTLSQSISVGPSLMSVRGVSLGDFDHDGKLDLIGASDPGFSVRHVQVFHGNGDGTFSYASRLSTSGGTLGTDLDALDINGDGNLDIMSSAGVWFGDGRGGFGNFQAATGWGLDSNNDSAHADFNNDGVLDSFIWETYSQSVYLGGAAHTNTMARLDLETRSGALQSLDLIDAAMQRVTRERSLTGSMMSRLEVELNTLATRRDQYRQAESRITDADIGFEAAELTRKRITQQSAAAVLGQANLLPQLVLRLLNP